MTEVHQDDAAVLDSSTARFGLVLQYRAHARRRRIRSAEGALPLPRRVGGHVPGISPPTLPAETPAIDALFAERRQALDARRQLRRLQDAQAAAPHRLGVRQLVRGRELLGKLLRAG